MRPVAAFILVLLIDLSLSACNPSQQTTQPDHVIVQLKWIHQAQFAGFYVAQEQGFYAEENIAVTFLPAGVGVDLFDSVLQGEAMFGVGGADSIIVERANGAPIVAIATTYRINPFVLVAFTDTGIRSPRDFAGRTVSVSSGYGDIIQLRAMLNRFGVELSSLTMVPYSYDHTAFLQGEIDVMNSFAAGGLLPLYEQIGDRELTLFWPGDYGVHVYSDTIFAQERLIEDDPDLVLRFLRATLRGHQFAVENPEIAVDASMIYAEIQDRDVQSAMFDASVPLIHTGADHIGWMRDDTWTQMHNLILEQGIIEEAINIDAVYTLQFLNTIYGEAP